MTIGYFSMGSCGKTFLSLIHQFIIQTLRNPVPHSHRGTMKVSPNLKSFQECSKDAIVSEYQRLVRSPCKALLRIFCEILFISG